jgi:hypothetical protein
MCSCRTAGSGSGLREKGGKCHKIENPCRHTYLHAYLDGCGISADPKGVLFRTIGRTTGHLTTTPLPQANAHTHDPPACCRRHQDPSRQSHLPRDRHQGWEKTGENHPAQFQQGAVGARYRSARGSGCKPIALPHAAGTLAPRRLPRRWR